MSSVVCPSLPVHTHGVARHAVEPRSDRRASRPGNWHGKRRPGATLRPGDHPPRGDRLAVRDKRARRRHGDRTARETRPGPRHSTEQRLARSDPVIASPAGTLLLTPNCLERSPECTGPGAERGCSPPSRLLTRPLSIVGCGPGLHEVRRSPCEDGTRDGRREQGLHPAPGDVPGGPLAHRVEQGTFNPKVPGSSPGRPTIRLCWFG